MLSHCDLKIYYEMIFLLAQHHQYSIEDLENLIPYERDIYYAMLIQHLKRLHESKKNKNG